MSVFHQDFVIYASEAAGIPKLNEDVISALTQDVEYRLREIIQDAKKFMRHSRRAVLTSHDIDSALKVKNIEPLFGFSASRPTVFKKADHQLYYLDDEELDFDKVLSTPLPKLPQEVCLSAHWLAIEGVQPNIPQNPVPSALQVEDKKSIISTSVPPPSSTSPTNNGTSRPTLQVKDVISKELQLYYEKITEAILSPDTAIQKVAFASICTDPGLQVLLPYFLKFIQERITKHLKHLPTLQLMITFLQHLLSNPHFFLEPYLHQVIPILLTTLLGKHLCMDPLSEDHWSLRDHSAKLLSSLLFQYTNSYPTLLPRVTRTLLVTLLDAGKPLTSKVGAVLALTRLGTDVVEASLLPNVAAYRTLFEAAETTDPTDDTKNEPTRRAKEKLLRVYACALAEFHCSQKSSSKLPSDTVVAAAATTSVAEESKGVDVDGAEVPEGDTPMEVDGSDTSSSKESVERAEKRPHEQEDILARYGPVLGAAVLEALSTL